MDGGTAEDLIIRNCYKVRELDDENCDEMIMARKTGRGGSLTFEETF